MSDHHQRLIRAMRVVMSAWAKRWRVVRREHERDTRGQVFIEHAKRCRDIAHRWSQKSLR